MNQGQQCFTKWEQQCRYANKPVCQTQTREFCDTHPIKECRFIKKPEYINVPVNKCTPKMEKQCFEYEGKACKATSNQYVANFTWTNDALNDGAMRKIEKCHNVKTCKITETMRQGTRKVPKRDCKPVSRVEGLYLCSYSSRTLSSSLHRLRDQVQAAVLPGAQASMHGGALLLPGPDTEHLPHLY